MAARPSMAFSILNMPAPSVKPPTRTSPDLILARVVRQYTPKET